jgi:hypothetical protein
MAKTQCLIWRNGVIKKASGEMASAGVAAIISGSIVAAAAKMAMVSIIK